MNFTVAFFVFVQNISLLYSALNLLTLCHYLLFYPQDKFHSDQWKFSINYSASSALGTTALRSKLRAIPSLWSILSCLPRKLFTILESKPCQNRFWRTHETGRTHFAYSVLDKTVASIRLLFCMHGMTHSFFWGLENITRISYAQHCRYEGLYFLGYNAV
jgi:hypothetical protein